VFPLPGTRLEVAVLSGESGNATLQETAHRICAAKGVEQGNCDVLWQTVQPQLGSKRDRQQLSDGLASRGVKLALFDSL
jgi:hypothetical protein